MPKLRPAALFGLLLTLAVGCAGPQSHSTGGPCEPDPVREPSAAEAFRTAAEWLPADTGAVAVIDGQQSLRVLERFLPPGAVSDDASGLSNVADTLRHDLSAVFLHYAGVDPLEATRIVVGFGRKWGVGVFFGEFDPPEEAITETTKIAGRTLYHAKFDVVFGAPELDLWMLPVDEPRPALVVFPDFKRLAEMALQARKNNRVDAPARDRILADVPGRLTPFEKLFAEVEDGRFLVAGRRVDTVSDFPPAQWLPGHAVVSFGDRLEAVISGPDKKLDTFASTVDTFRSQLHDALAEPPVPENQSHTRPTFLDAAGRAVMLRLMGAYDDALKTRREDGLLHYRMPLPTDDRDAALLLSAVAGYATTGRIFEEPEPPESSKVDRAEQRLAKLVDGAKSYYTSDQRICRSKKRERACPEVWHTGQTVGMPVQFTKYVFSGGPNVKLVSHSSIPTLGRRRHPAPQLRRAPAHVQTKDVLARLNVPFEEPTYFRFTYETGPKRGPKATATLRAEADFDGEGPPNHTIIQRITVEPDGGVVIKPMVPRNEFQ